MRIILLCGGLSTKKRRALWMHPYMRRNFDCRPFIAAQELSQDDRRFQSFY
jgi:hypothetical protein